MHTDDFNYELPSSKIALFPPKLRGKSKLLVVNRQTGEIKHNRYEDLYKFLNPGDLVILNKTKVFPARLTVKNKDKKREFLLLERHSRTLDTHNWKVIYKGNIRPKEVYNLANAEIIVNKVLSEGLAIISSTVDLLKLSEEHGKTPIPPYLHRNATKNDSIRYQTEFADTTGSVAAPTASLNFTLGLKEKLIKQNTNVAYITLHVGLGTFLPIRTNSLEKHIMHSEYFEIPPSTQHAIQQAKKNGNKVLAVGTTVTRALEYAQKEILRMQTKEISGEADIFIYPGYSFKIVDSLLTNFHAPKSTVLMMASAFAGQNNLQKAYKSALRNDYKFLSYGDSMLII